MVISSIHMDSHVRANTKATLQTYTEVDSSGAWALVGLRGWTGSRQ